MLTRLRQTLIGTPLPSASILHERLNRIQALAVFSSDALSSVAYATEEILLVLVVAGAAALDLSRPIALAIVALLYRRGETGKDRVIIDVPYHLRR